MSEYGFYLDGNDGFFNNAILTGFVTLPKNLVENDKTRNAHSDDTNKRLANYILKNKDVLVYNYNPQTRDMMCINVESINNNKNILSDYGVIVDDLDLTSKLNKSYKKIQSIEIFSNKYENITIKQNCIYIYEFVKNSYVKFNLTNDVCVLYTSLPRFNRNDRYYLFQPGGGVIHVGYVHVYESNAISNNDDYGILISNNNINTTFLSAPNTINVSKTKVEHTQIMTIDDAATFLSFDYGAAKYKTGNKLLINSAPIMFSESGFVYDNGDIIYSYAYNDTTSQYDGDIYSFHGLPYNSIIDVN